MDCQVKSPGGNSFWDLSHIRWEELKFDYVAGHSSEWLVDWEGRRWVCKRKDESISEVVGYQIAEALGISLQPWAAFYQKKVIIRSRRRAGQGF